MKLLMLDAGYGSLLDRLDEIQSSVNSKKQKVDRFLYKLKIHFENYSGKYGLLLAGSTFFGTGSSFEGTAVRETADFDIIMLLPPPFVIENFKLQEVDISSGIYKVKHNSNRYYGAVRRFLNGSKYLKVKQLKEAVFDELDLAMKDIARREHGVQYEFHRIVSSYRIVIRSTAGYNIKLDVVPQIGVQVKDLPDWNFFMPTVVCEYIEKKHLHAFCKLAYPPYMEGQSYEHLTMQVSFNDMESYCIMASKNVRDAIRLTKAVAKHYGWAKKGLLSFHIKRTAIYIYDSLKLINPWSGYQLILLRLASMLENKRIDGVFIRGQDIKTKDVNTGFELAREIRTVFGKTESNNILNILQEYI